jgi:DNA repair protein RadC
MPQNLTIKQWNSDDRPREKLLEKGASSLSVAELMAIVIGSGSPGESAVALMKRVLHNHQNGLGDLQNSCYKTCFDSRELGWPRP